ncbi:MAG TPA: PAS domain-containing protein [Bryobacteraceae bacterium]|nr:PAS domain-containing protein [Bryobacteraceae bacterium]
MFQSKAATHSSAAEDQIRKLESKIEQLLLENSKLREEFAVLEARAGLVSQHEDQRVIDAVRFRAILANNRSGIVLLAPNGTVVESVHSIFGYEKNQLLGRDPSQFMRPDSAGRFQRDLEYVVQTPGAEHQGEYCIQDAAGEQKWVEAILSDQLSQPAIQAIVCNYRDITDRKLAEAKHALANSIVQSSGSAIVSFDFDGRILSWNPGAAEMYGYTPEEMIGENVSKLSLPSQLEADAGLRQMVRDGKIVQPFCTRRLNRNGSIVEVFLSTGALRNGDGELIGWFHIASRGCVAAPAGY